MSKLSAVNAVLGIAEKITKLLSIIHNHYKKEEKCDDYYYEEYNKKIFVRKNGDGVVVSSCVLKVVDPNEVRSLIRTLDISDAKKSSHFDTLEKMQQTSLDDVFSSFGFWYTSENDIVTDVEEFYEGADSHRKNDDRFISIKLIIDTAKIEAGKTYRITHAFSVPGLFPIADGRFDVLEQNRDDYPDFGSHIVTEHISHHLSFAAYFEEGIVFKDRPKGHYKSTRASKKNKRDITTACQFKDNIFYQKYSFHLENPQDYTDISIKWNLKNPIQ